MSYYHAGNCVVLGAELIHELRDNAQDATLHAMARALRGDLARWARSVGYDRCRAEGAGCTLSGDWHVSYHRSHLDRDGERIPAWYLCWSGYEHVWLPDGVSATSATRRAT